MITITPDRSRHEHQVWLANGSLLAVGKTRAAALLAAEAELSTALDAVRQELVKEGVVTRIGVEIGVDPGDENGQ